MKPRILVPLIVLAGLVALVLLLPRLLVGQIQGKLEQRLSTVFGPPVSVGDVDLNLFQGPKLQLRDVTAGSGTRAVSLDRLGLQLALRPLLRREIEVVAAEVDSLRLSWKLDPSAAVDTAGAPAGGTLPPAGPAAGKFAPLAILIHSLQLSNGQIHLFRGDDMPLVEIEGLATQLSAASRAATTDLTAKLNASEVRFHLPGGGSVGDRIPVRLDATLRFDANEDRLQVTNAAASLGELPLSLTGEVTGMRTAPNATLHLSGGPAEISGIAGLLPSRMVPALDGLRSSGTVAVQADVDGSIAPGTIPNYGVQLDLTDGSIEHPTLPEPLRGIVLHLRADPEKLDIQTLSAESARSRFQVAGTITDYRTPAPNLALDVEGDVDLTLVSKLQPPKPDQPDLSGRAAGKLRVQGPLGATPDQLGLHGTIDLTDAAVSGGNMESPVTGINGRVTLQNQAASTERVSLSMRGSDLVVSGKVDDYWAFRPEATDRRTHVDVALKSPMLDLDAWMPPPGSTPGAGVNAGEAGAANPSGASSPASSAAGAASPSGASSPAGAASAAAASSADARLLVFAILSRLDGPIAVDVAKARVRGVDVTHAAGKGSLDRGKINVDQLSFNTFGGTMQTDGWVDLSRPERPTMDLDVEAGGVSVQELFAHAKQIDRVAQLARFVNGRVDLEAKLQGAMDSNFQLDIATLTSLGKLAFREGRLQGHPFQAELASFLNASGLRDVPIREWLQPFELREGRLEYTDLKVSAGGVDLLATGWQSLEGKMQMTAELRLPPSLSAGLKSTVPAELQDLVFEPVEGRIRIPIQASGPTSAPKVTLDAQALGAQVQARLAARAAAERQKLQDAATEEIQKLEGKARDEAGRALKDKAGDVLGGLAGKDSANADSTAKLEDQLEGVLKGIFKKR